MIKLNLPVLILVFSTFLYSCKKDALPGPNPQSDFSVSEYGGFGITYTDTAFIIGTHDALMLHNLSANSDSISWNFGDGRISTDNDALLTYDSAGIFQVVLTAYGKNGQTSISSIPVTVKERVLKSFSIDNLDINKFAPSQNDLPTFTTIDLWMEIKLSRSSADLFTSNGDIMAPVVYKSPFFTNIDSSFHSSINFTIPETNKALVFSPVSNSDYYSGGRGLIINLYGQDPTGTYLLSSSAWSGIGISLSNGGNPAMVKSYDLKTYVAGSPTTIVLNCQFQ